MYIIIGKWYNKIARVILICLTIVIVKYDFYLPRQKFWENVYTIYIYIYIYIYSMLIVKKLT